MMDIVSPLLPASPQAAEIARLFYVALIIAAVILLVVAGMVFIIIIRNRRLPRDYTPKQDFGNETLEWTWTIVPLMIVTGLFVYTAMDHSFNPYFRTHGVFAERASS